MALIGVDQTGLRQGINPFSRTPPGPTTEFYKPNVLKETAHGVARGTQGMVGSVGDMAFWLGEGLQDPEMKEWGKRHSDWWRRAATTGAERPREEIMNGWQHPFLKSAALLGEALPSVALGAAGTKAAYAGARGMGLIGDWNKANKLAQFGIAFVGTQPLGAVIGSGFYREARDSGLSVGKASQLAMISWMGESALEVFPMMEWMKGGGNPLRRFFRVGLTEGLEEVTQGVLSNSLKVYGWKGTNNLYEDITDGLLEGFVGGFLAGGLLGTTNPNIIEDMSSDLKRKLDRDGVRDQAGKKLSYDSVEKTVMSIADKLAANTKDLAIKAEQALKTQAGLLKTGQVARFDSEAPVTAKIDRSVVRGKERSRIVTTPGKEVSRGFNKLNTDEQKVVGNSMDTFLQTLKLNIEKGRRLQLFDQKVPRIVRDKLLDISTRAYKLKQQIDKEDVLDVFRANDIYIVGGEGSTEGELGSAATGVFYGPRMVSGGWGYAPHISAEKFVSGLAQSSRLERDNPLYVDLKDIQFHGTKSLSPTELAKTFLREIKGSYQYKLVPSDYVVTSDDFEVALTSLGYTDSVQTAIQNVFDAMRDGSDLLSSFKDMNILIRRTADLNSRAKLFAAFIETEQETVELYADAVEREFTTTNRGNFNTLEEAIAHVTLHEFVHHLLRTDQAKLRQDYAKKKGRTQIAENVLTQIWDKVRARKVLSGDKLATLINDEHSEDLMSYIEEVAAESVAYKYVKKISDKDALRMGLGTAEYSGYHANLIEGWVEAYNQRNKVKITMEDVRGLIALFYAHAAAKATTRVAIAKEKNVSEKVKGAATLKITSQRYNQERTKRRESRSYFRESEISVSMIIADIVDLKARRAATPDKSFKEYLSDLITLQERKLKALRGEKGKRLAKVTDQQRADLRALGYSNEEIAKFEKDFKKIFVAPEPSTDINVPVFGVATMEDGTRKRVLLSPKEMKDILARTRFADHPRYKAIQAVSKKVDDNLKNVHALDKVVQSESMEEAKTVGHEIPITQAEYNDIQSILREKKAQAEHQNITSYPIHDLQEQIKSVRSELDAHVTGKYVDTKGQIQLIFQREKAIVSLEQELALLERKLNETVKQADKKAAEGEQIGVKAKKRKDVVTRLNQYKIFLSQVLKRNTKGGKINQVPDKYVKDIDTVFSALNQIRKQGYTYLNIEGEEVTVNFKGETWNIPAKLRDPAGLDEMYANPAVALNNKLRQLINQIDKTIDVIHEESKADRDRIKYKNHLRIEKDISLFDTNTQQDVWLPGSIRGEGNGDYRTEQRGKHTYIWGFPGSMLALNNKGVMAPVDYIVVDNSLMIDAEGEFTERSLEDPVFKDIPRSTRNSLWTDQKLKFQELIDKATQGERSTVMGEAVNPDLEEIPEYGRLLQMYIAMRKKINPALDDEEVRKALPGKLGERLSTKITLAPEEHIEEIVGNYMKERHLAQLAGFNGARITSVITRRVWDRIQKKYPLKNMEQQKVLLETYLSVMLFANQEIIPVRGQDNYMLSDIGLGGNWQQGNINAKKYKGKTNTAERDTTIEIYKALRSDLGKPVDAAEEKALMQSRPTQLFWNLLDDKTLQDMVFLTKQHIENPIFDELLSSGLLDRTDNLANIRRGFTHMFWVHKDETLKMSRIRNIKLSKNIPEHKYRTATESVMATGMDEEFGTGLKAIVNYAAAMGDYVNGSMQRVNQVDMIGKFKEMVPVDENGVPKIKDLSGNAYKLGYIAYETDPEVAAQSQRNPRFLSTLGYIQMHDVPGLIQHRGGAIIHPWVHRDIAPLIKQLYQTQEKSKYMTGLLKLNGMVKKNIMLSPYNFAIQIASSPMLWLDDKVSMWNPKLGKRAFDLGIKPLFWNGGLVTAGIKEGIRQRQDPNPFSHIEESEMKPELVNLFIRHGARNFNVAWVMESLFDTEMLEKHPLLRTEAENMREIMVGKGGVDAYVFNHYVGRIMYSFMSSMTQRFQAEGHSLDDSARLAVSFANDTSGMIDKHIYGSEGRLLQALFFARDFTMSFFRQVTGATYPLWKDAHRYRVENHNELNSLLHGDKSKKDMQYLSKYYQAHLAKVMLIKMFLFTLLQFGMSFIGDDEEERKDIANRKRWMFKNEPGKFGVIRTPFQAPSGEPIYMDPLLWREATQLITLSPLGRGPQSFFLGKLSWSIKTGYEQLANKTYQGFDITDGSGVINVGQQVIDRAMYAGKSALPTFTAPKGKANFFINAATSAVGFPLKTGTAAKNPENLLRMRRAASVEKYYSEKTVKKIKEADPKKLRRMLFNREITATQYRNEIMRRRYPDVVFRKRNRAKLRRHLRRMR